MEDERTLSVTGDDERGGESGSSALVAALTAEDALAAPRCVVLDGLDEINLARGSGADERKDAVLSLGFPDRWMSSPHARLRRDGEHWTIEDRGSKNGVFRNHARQKSATLGDGDVLELGHTFFVFRRGLPPEVPTPASSFNPTLIRAHATLERVAGSDLPVMVSGETGTGKELIARAVHDLSRRSGPFLAVNCGALPATLLESELFGFRKGAFSGATEDRPGLVRASHGGTLFLDEIGELPAAAQTALLRVLQEREVHPVGATRPVPVDIRVVAATHRNLDEAVEEGQFRADLLARLGGFKVRLPPLRERREDLGLLIRALMASLAPARKQLVFTHEGARLLFRRAWRKNVRALERCLGAALVLAGDGPVGVEHLGDDPGEEPAPRAVETPDDEDGRRETIAQLLAEHNGNVAAVARAMNKARELVHRWIKKYGIDPNAYRK